MNKTKIDWCDMTWNPVTGCLHNCPYCYAAKIARRFGNHQDDPNEIYVLDRPEYIYADNGEGTINTYPFDFNPTFHAYRLDEPLKIKKPQNIFVCSMADLFGDWIPDEWIKQVFEACLKAPQHRYLFLTKNPKRYMKLFSASLTQGPIIDNLPDNFWFGITATNGDEPFFWSHRHNNFLSIEPIQDEFGKYYRMFNASFVNWVIIGAETGNRKGKIIPKKEWIENIVNYCKEKNVPVFMKNNLAGIWKEPLIQEYPWRNE